MHVCGPLKRCSTCTSVAIAGNLEEGTIVTMFPARGAAIRAWRLSNVIFQQSVAAMNRQAMAEYPSECCGIVTGRADVQHIHPLVNIQDACMPKIPQTHPRDSRSAYAVDRNEVERIIHESARANETVLAFYHSHIDCDAYFSQMDKRSRRIFGSRSSRMQFTWSLHYEKEKFTR